MQHHLVVWAFVAWKGCPPIVRCGVLIVDTLATARSLAIQQMQGAVCNNWCLDRSTQRTACTWVNVSGNNIPWSSYAASWGSSIDAAKKKVLRPQNTKGCPCSSLIEYSVAQYATPLEHYFARASSETVSFLRPLARRAASTLRPLAVAILSRKPCLFLLFLLEGWNVLFIFVYTILCYYSMRSGCKISDFFLIIKVLNHF